MLGFRKVPRLNVAETSWFELNELAWLWVKSDGKAPCFRMQRRRKLTRTLERGAAGKAMPLLPLGS